MNTDMYKDKLITEKDLLTKELIDLGAKLDPETGNWEATPEVTDSTADENDMGDKYEDYETNNEKVETLEERLNDIGDALAKLENGKFGICEVCGAQIEEDRLDANPAAKTCKACMEK
jgi:RNA polymerase-binding transcription factor DksA